MNEKSKNRYQALVEHLFFQRYEAISTTIEFTREDLIQAAEELGINVPKNIGDVLYSFRYRNPLPTSILATQSYGKEWIIEGAGSGRYEFRLVAVNRILPNPNLITIRIPDNTPELIAAHSLSDEQALLAKIRYNRLIDIFLGLTTYSLQNHLRTTVKGLGQIEIDEIYVGIDRYGCQYVIPVQAKGGTDQLASVQTRQDIACCVEKFPNLVCRAVSTRFLDTSRIAVFELCLDQDGFVRVVEERHYQLVPAMEISDQELTEYRQRASR